MHELEKIHGEWSRKCQEEKRVFEQAAKAKQSAERALVKWKDEVNTAEEAIHLLSIVADKIKQKEALDRKFESAERRWNVLKETRNFALSRKLSVLGKLNQARTALSKAKQQAKGLEESGGEA